MQERSILRLAHDAVTEVPLSWKTGYEKTVSFMLINPRGKLSFSLLQCLKSASLLLDLLPQLVCRARLVWARSLPTRVLP